MKNRLFPEDPKAESAIALIRIQRNQALRDKYPSRRIEGPLVTLPPREDDKGFWFMNAFRMVKYTVLILISIVGFSVGCHVAPRPRPIVFTQDSAGHAVVIIPDEVDHDDSLCVPASGHNDTANNRWIYTLLLKAPSLTGRPDTFAIANLPKSTQYKVEVIASRTTESNKDRIDRLFKVKKHRVDSLIHLSDSVGKIVDDCMFKANSSPLDLSHDDFERLVVKFNRNKAIALRLLHSADSTLTDNKIYQ